MATGYLKIVTLDHIQTLFKLALPGPEIGEVSFFLKVGVV